MSYTCGPSITPSSRLGAEGAGPPALLLAGQLGPRGSSPRFSPDPLPSTYTGTRTGQDWAWGLHRPVSCHGHDVGA